MLQYQKAKTYLCSGFLSVFGKCHILHMLFSWAVLGAWPALCCLFPPQSGVSEVMCLKGEFGGLIWPKSNCFCQIIFGQFGCLSWLTPLLNQVSQGRRRTLKMPGAAFAGQQLKELCTSDAYGGQNVVLTWCGKQSEGTVFREFSSFTLFIH